MSAEKRWRIVAYDVRCPKRYRQVFKILRGVGRSVQYSIFRCRLDAREVEQLRWNLEQVMASEDRLLVIDLCPTCASSAVSRNHVDGWTQEPAAFAILSGTSCDQAPAGVSAPHLRTSDEPAKTRRKRSE